MNSKYFQGQPEFYSHTTVLRSKRDFQEEIKENEKLGSDQVEHD